MSRRLLTKACHNHPPLRKGGQGGSFRARVTSWTAMLNVTPIGFEPIEESENDMSKSKVAKGKDSRFKKTDRGRFTLSGNA